MNPLFIFGGLAIIGAMVAMQSQGYGDRDWEDVDPLLRVPIHERAPDYGGTGASEEAYWSDFGEGRHIRVPGRVG